jgi:hypothetical protein
VPQRLASTRIGSGSSERASKPGAGDSIQTFGLSSQRTAVFTFNRPAVRTSPASSAPSTERSSSDFKPTPVAPGKRALASAAAPATWGAAIDVPSEKRYPPPGQVE